MRLGHTLVQLIHLAYLGVAPRLCFAEVLLQYAQLPFCFVNRVLQRFTLHFGVAAHLTAVAQLLLQSLDLTTCLRTSCVTYSALLKYGNVCVRMAVFACMYVCMHALWVSSFLRRVVLVLVHTYVHRYMYAQRQSRARTMRVSSFASES
jgi:hypothetical protein